jgi:molybdenum cofactor synthesis domain-containing protein
MLSVDEARDQILAMMPRLAAEPVNVSDAANRVLASEVVAPRDVPGFDNSAMDGFAVRAGDLAAAGNSPISLRVSGEAAAGAAFAGLVASGEAVRIMTGAPLPDGADAVVEVEETSSEGSDVRISIRPDPGRNVRPAGSDIRRGEVAMQPGTVLGPAQLALLGALGTVSIEAVRRPLVAVVATGNEVVGPGHELAPGQVYDAITPAVSAAIAAAGGQPLVVPRARDSADDIRRALREAADADVVLSIGGVSMGAYDLVRPAVEELGDLDFWKVAMRPGKPLAVGRVLGRPFVGLPGNPVSALVGFELFVLPLLLQVGGREGWRRPSMLAEMAAPLTTPAGLRTFARARLERRDGALPLAHPAAGQSSHQLHWLAQSNALLDIAAETSTVAAGERVVAILVDQPPSLPG